MTDKPLSAKVILRKMLWLLPALFFCVLSTLAFSYPQVIETVYSRAIYPYIMRPVSGITGVLPFSLGELLLYAFMLFLLLFVVKTAVDTYRAKKGWWQVLVRRALTTAVIASTLYAAFVGLFSLNYARLPLAQTFDLDVAPASIEELQSTARRLVEKANALRAQIKAEQGDMRSDYASRMAILKSVPSYYDGFALMTGMDFLGGGYGPVKPVLYSTGLSYAYIEGVYFPFTGEANINMKAPMLLFAASALHEAAHQRGFAREDEANFLAYYVGSYADDITVRYSTAVLAMTHVLNALHDADGEAYAKLDAMISVDVRHDVNDSNRFWKQYQGSVSEASAKVTDGYLKANSQQDGIKSYGRMVDLMIGLYRQGGI